MRKYFTLFLTLFVFSIKSKLSYRFNLIFKLLYGPAYVGVLFTILLIAYNRTPELAGWNKQEALLLFSVFNVIYANCLIIFMDSIRHLLWSGIRLGEVDQWLLKPGSTQFYLTFSRPNTDLLGLWLCVMGIFIYQIFNLQTISLFNFLSFIILFLLGHVVVYLTLSIYSTLGFFVARAQQVVEVFDKASDFAQYPIGIFPQSLQLLLTTLLPIAYYSYYPTLFLKNEGSTNILIQSVLLTFVLFLINKFSWRYALRHYSSASS